MARKKRTYVQLIVVVVVAVAAAMLARNHKLSDLTDDFHGATNGPTTAPSAPAARQAMAQLNKLTVAKPLSMAGYSREKFPHWIDQQHGCDTRGVVLRRQGKGVTENDECTPQSGHWTSSYDNKVVNDSSDLDIDHMVPLADAWRSGAKNWTTDKRRRFANDLKDPQLVAVTASSNRSKGDQDPSTWKPPYRPYWCEYARDWIRVKSVWHLTVTGKEKDALVGMLHHCGT